ncbi:hypothetical protein BDAP_001562 [Binucleata daphniae]
MQNNGFYTNNKHTEISNDDVKIKKIEEVDVIEIDDKQIATEKTASQSNNNTTQNKNRYDESDNDQKVGNKSTDDAQKNIMHKIKIPIYDTYESKQSIQYEKQNTFEEFEDKMIHINKDKNDTNGIDEAITYDLETFNKYSNIIDAKHGKIRETRNEIECHTKNDDETIKKMQVNDMQIVDNNDETTSEKHIIISSNTNINKPMENNNNEDANKCDKNDRNDTNEAMIKNDDVIDETQENNKRRKISKDISVDSCTYKQTNNTNIINNTNEKYIDEDKIHNTEQEKKNDKQECINDEQSACNTKTDLQNNIDEQTNLNKENKHEFVEITNENKDKQTTENDEIVQECINDENLAQKTVKSNLPTKDEIDDFLPFYNTFISTKQSYDFDELYFYKPSQSPYRMRIYKPNVPNYMIDSSLQSLIIDDFIFKLHNPSYKIPFEQDPFYLSFVDNTPDDIKQFMQNSAMYKRFECKKLRTFEFSLIKRMRNMRREIEKATNVFTMYYKSKESVVANDDKVMYSIVQYIKNKKLILYRLEELRNKINYIVKKAEENWNFASKCCYIANKTCK